MFFYILNKNLFDKKFPSSPVFLLDETRRKNNNYSFLPWSFFDVSCRRLSVGFSLSRLYIYASIQKLILRIPIKQSEYFRIYHAYICH